MPKSSPVARLAKELKAREKEHASEMQGPLHPPVSLLCKLGSIAVHAEEGLSSDGHHFDMIALRQLMADAEVIAWLDGMRRAAFLPVKRNEPATVLRGPATAEERDTLERKP